MNVIEQLILATIASYLAGLLLTKEECVKPPKFELNVRFQLSGKIDIPRNLYFLVASWIIILLVMRI